MVRGVAEPRRLHVVDVGCALRDGLARDLAALDIVAAAVQRCLAEDDADADVLRLLRALARSLDADVEELRALIAEFSAA